MTEFKHQEYRMSVNVTAEELDRPRIIRGPIWRDVLVNLGLLRPIYGETLREQMVRARRGQEQHMRMMMDEVRRSNTGNPFANTFGRDPP